eukprot:SAG31_NODE_4983_length_2820_cov_1.565968_2_plen_91_part_00
MLSPLLELHTLCLFNFQEVLEADVYTGLKAPNLKKLIVGTTSHFDSFFRLVPESDIALARRFRGFRNKVAPLLPNGVDIVLQYHQAFEGV